MNTSNKSVLVEDWPEACQFKKSIRLEFSIYLSGIILILMIITGYTVTNQYVKTVTQNIIEKLLVQARSYSGPAGKLIISTDGPDVLLLNNICKKIAADNQDLHWTGITNQDYKFLAHSDLNKVISSSQLTPFMSESLGDILHDEETFNFKDDTIFITVPIKENDILVGWLSMASSTKQITEARKVSILTVASITVFMILLGIPVTMFVLHRKLAPVSIITNRLKNINFSNLNLEIPIFSKNEFGYLAETLRVMGNKLNIAQRELIEQERISRELEIAREIQANILPREYPRYANFEFACFYKSAKEVGGDYYDFIEYDDQNLAFLVADVSGKSLPGMLVMLLTRDMVKRLARTIKEPAKLLAEVNKELLSNIKKGMFVTMFYGVLDTDKGNFTFASAGHNPLIKMNGLTGTPELIKTKGYPLGMMSPDQFNSRIETGAITLNKNDWLIQFTDGVNEAQNPAGEEFGMERFIRLLESLNSKSPKELVQEALNRHSCFVDTASQFDDITMLAMKWMGSYVDINNNIIKESVDDCNY